MAAKLLFGNELPVEVHDARGQVMPAAFRKEGPGLHRLVIELNGSVPQVIAVTFPTVPKTLAFKAHEGILPWMASEINAPFPDDP